MRRVAFPIYNNNPERAKRRVASRHHHRFAGVRARVDRRVGETMSAAAALDLVGVLGVVRFFCSGTTWSSMREEGLRARVDLRAGARLLAHEESGEEKDELDAHAEAEDADGDDGGDGGGVRHVDLIELHHGSDGRRGRVDTR